MTARVSLGVVLGLILVGCDASTNSHSATQASKPDVVWSEPVNGLRGRLIVLPSEKPHQPFCRVYIELENVSDVAGQKKIRFNPDKLTLAVTDIGGKRLPVANGPYDGMAPLWEPILLPFDGTTKFRISFPGLGYKPETDKVIVDVGPSRSWIVPQDGAYYLSGTLSIKKKKGDHPYMDWSGTLVLPGVAIPKGKE